VHTEGKAFVLDEDARNLPQITLQGLGQRLHLGSYPLDGRILVSAPRPLNLQAVIPSQIPPVPGGAAAQIVEGAPTHHRHPIA
jgi:hypothetical protein